MSIEKEQASTPVSFDYLNGEQFILLKTFRKSGQAVPTPVWFAQDQGKLYITTMKGAAKVKRIHNNGSVLLAPCNRGGAVHGPEISGLGRELPLSEQPHAKEVLARKYGLLYKIIMTIGKLRKTQQTILEIQPGQ
ncbi:PPOX class F420-dependent oxidoreductase [Dictyobacter kobayashii]|uniref:PPOX class F420-dependent oxidoreductase n=1 Tax=Dictyobacter kobayashii TaxID=2014872 RepID=A0A402AHF0_9CHLR|nr:PPOX class F420-dependent oxidoreductase [Dictyobacter kobayashii]GCE18536.1 PPOX class F420-dependent oxidoreductase [Dictyobacter kobayashii]